MRLPKWIATNAYMLMLVGTVVLATILPVSGVAAEIVSKVTYGAVALLFFLYGSKLKSEVIIAGVTNWKLQAIVLGTTFVVFPGLGFGVVAIFGRWLPPELVLGLLFLSILPSTVQSSIALTAMARGNVPAAICAASVSSLVGVFITPLLAAVVLSTKGVLIDSYSVLWIALQVLLPFAVGQALRPLIGARVERAKLLTTIVDRGSILLIVYSAFSAGVVGGLWNRVDPPSLLLVVALDLAMLFIIIGFVTFAGRKAALSRADSVSLLFCGSQKSLATGVPMANVLFAGTSTGLIILPLMLYHQIQLFVSAAIAQRLANRPEAPASSN
jgi:sodium/bile acid cotransporter 7